MKILSFELTSGAHGGFSRMSAPSSAAYAVPRLEPVSSDAAVIWRLYFAMLKYE